MTSAILWLHAVAVAGAENLTTGTQSVKFGVHEIALTGRGDVDNPFDTLATVTFVPPSGPQQAKTVSMYFDGDNHWRARVYVHETGEWSWSSRSATDTRLDGKSGRFSAVDSKLRGRLLPHPKNPRHWMTEDGRWFLNLNDTAYFLLCTHDGAGEPISSADFSGYVDGVAAKGITSVRCFLASGPKGFKGPENTDRHRWYDIFTDETCDRLQLGALQNTDRRLRWLLDEHPDVYVQLVLFPLGSGYAKDDTFWVAMSPAQRERLMRHLLARYAAFPQLFWLIANDVHYSEKFPNNNAYVREVGEYFQRHDPWRHPMSTGHARRVPFYFGGEDWATYIHLEDEADLGAQKYAPYHQFSKPVFLGEDRYEQDHGPVRDPADMPYFQRRLFWSWLLSGGSTNYGGRWWTVQPYSQTGSRPSTKPLRPGITFSAQLTGLDSVPVIPTYFQKRAISLPDFEPAHELVRDGEQERPLAQTIKVMRRGAEEFLIYHPNAAAEGKESTVDRERSAKLQIDLRGDSGSYIVEWLRAEDGTVREGGVVTGGDWRTLSPPWKGHDCVVRLLRRS